ncbi:MAG: hypothetical protein Fues2KO_23730 [Fuerstiella sp.]
MPRTLRRIQPACASAAGTESPSDGNSHRAAVSQHGPSDGHLLKFPQRVTASDRSEVDRIARQIDQIERLLQRAEESDPAASTSATATRPATAALPTAAETDSELQSKSQSSDRRSTRATGRVVLRLNRTTIRVLQELARSGRRPNRFIESALRRDSVFRDAAAILGVSLQRQTAVNHRQDHHPS